MTFALTRRAVLGGLGTAVLSRSAALAAEAPPPVIHFAGVNGGYAKPFGTGLIGIVQHFDYIENELKPYDVRIGWQFPEGTGPAINEAIAAGRVARQHGLLAPRDQGVRPFVPQRGARRSPITALLAFAARGWTVI
jgi:hypothetical protein